MIPVNEPLLGGRALDYVSDCIRTGWVSSEGDYVRSFEEAWADYCGASHGVAVSSGTAALEVSVAALRLEPGSEVILPAFTIISCAQAILAARCVPVLVDVEPDTFNMAIDQVEAKVTSRTRAIMPVHMFGHPVDMQPLLILAQRHGLRVIEDAAEAHGAEYQGRKVGGIGDLGCFSFYANKIITTGEGGMVLTNDEALAERLRSLRNMCFRADRRFLHTELGHNYRLTNLQAALGLAQVEQIDTHLRRKRAIAMGYSERLADFAGIRLPVERTYARSVCWMYAIVLDDEAPLASAEQLAAELAAASIATRPLFVGMHQQPALLQLGLFAGERYPVTERLAERGLYLPSGLTLSEDQQDQVCAALGRALGQS